MADSVFEDVADTAFMVARERALEGERPDALFRDPLADRLAGERGERIVAALGDHAALGIWGMAIRTVLIDDYIRAAVAGGVTLVANLGAGLDTRPYRMELPGGLQWVEVDFPKVIELKAQGLAAEQPRCRLERVALDLSDRAARGKLLRDLSARSANILVITEGVVPYLSAEEVASLADDLHSLEHFRLWIVDYFSHQALQSRRRQAMAKRMENAPFRFEPDDWFGFFREHGWPLREVRYLAEEGVRLGRPMPVPLPTPAASRLLLRLRGLLSSRGRDELRRFAGYGLLERPP
jgi:methyltransferase (TIGR00027 family)